jgi:hypothetical protein
LRENEVGLETDTKSFKVGDGVTSWRALPYYIGRAIPSEDKETKTVLLGDKIEIEAINEKGVFTSSRIYFGGHPASAYSDAIRSYLDRNGLYTLEGVYKSILKPKGLEVSVTNS